MVQIMRKLVEAERLGNWYLHLQALSEKATIISRVSVQFLAELNEICSVSLLNSILKTYRRTFMNIILPKKSEML